MSRFIVSLLHFPIILWNATKANGEVLFPDILKVHHQKTALRILLVIFLFTLSFSSDAQVFKGRVISLYSSADADWLDNKIEHTWRLHYKDNLNSTYVREHCVGVDTDPTQTPYTHHVTSQIFSKSYLPSHFRMKLDGYEDDAGSRCYYNDNDELFQSGQDAQQELEDYKPGVWSTARKITTVGGRYHAYYQIYYAFDKPQTPIVTSEGSPLGVDPICAEEPLNISTSLNSPNQTNISYEWQYHISGDQTVTTIPNPAYCDCNTGGTELGRIPPCCDEPETIDKIELNWHSFSTSSAGAVDFSVTDFINLFFNRNIMFRVVARAGDIVSTSDPTGFFTFSPASPSFEITSVKPTCPETDNGRVDFTITSDNSRSFEYSIYYEDEDWATSSGTFLGSEKSVSGLSQGNYRLEVGKTEGCRVDSEFEIDIYPPIEITNPSVKHISCSGANDGTIDLSVTGGEPNRNIAYTLIKNNIIIDENLSGEFNRLSSGTYKVIASDGGCSPNVSQNFTIKEPSLVSAKATPSDLTCDAEPDGIVKVTAIKGGIDDVSEYNIYLLKDEVEVAKKEDFSGSSYTFSSVAAGNYTIKVEDANRPDCGFASEEVTLELVPLKIEGSDVNNPTCSYKNDGAIYVSASQGAGEYTFSLSGDASDSNDDGEFENLAAGSYVVTVSNNNTCSDSDSLSFVLTSPDPVEVEETITHITCINENNGKIEITASGGTGDFSYQWYKEGGIKLTGKTNKNLSGVGAGKYYVEVKDANSCVFTSSTFEIEQPDEALDLSYEKTNIVCFGETNGKITATANGGWGSYKYYYQINGASGWNRLYNSTTLAAGTYNIKVTDDLGCTVNRNNITITAPANSISGTPSVADVTCKGKNDGLIKITPSGGNGTGYGNNYFFSIKIGTGSYSAYTSGKISHTYSSLAKGTYTVRIKDKRGCVKYLPPVIIDEPETLELSISDVVNVLCYSQRTGEVTLDASGGNTGYQFKIGSGSYQSSNVFTGLGAGDYTFTVLDNKGCTSTATASITQPAGAVTIDITATSKVTCNNGANGSITASVSGGGNNALQWQQNIGGSWIDLPGQTSNKISNLSSGSYQLRVYNSEGGECDVLSEVVNLPNPGQLDFDEVIVKQITCKGDADATIAPFASGGWGGYKYYYSFDESDPSISFTSSTSFGPGNYKIKVTDEEGCSFIYGTTINITEPPTALSATLTKSNHNGNNISCKGATDGEITINPSGGNGEPFDDSYTYSINDGTYSTSNTFTNLSEGNYTIKVKDNRGCIITVEASLTEPDELKISVEDKNRIKCFGEQTGFVDLITTGGTAPYTYSLNGSSFQEDPSFTALGSGSYNVVVKDANGCIDPVSFLIDGPESAIDIILEKQDIICHNSGDGMIKAIVSGGWGDYTFQWQKYQDDDFVNISGEENPEIHDLNEGRYRIKITDKYLCSIFSESVELVNPDPLEFTDIIPQQITCKGDNNGIIDAAVIGGWGDYVLEYSLDNWATSHEFISTTLLNPGTYFIRVKDKNGCYAYYPEEINLTEPSISLSATFEKSQYDIFNISCKGLSDGEIIINPIGGNGVPFENNYYYSLDDQPYVEENIFTGLSAGVYTINVKDERGCTFTDNVVLVEPSAVFASYEYKNYIKCYGDSSGFIEVKASGGVAPFQYKLDDRPWVPENVFEDLPAATYSITVKDVNGCTDSFEETIIQPYDSLSIEFSSTNISCFDGNDGSIETSVFGGNAPYTYIWDDDLVNSNQRLDLPAGKFKLTVTDNEGCATVDSVLLTQPDEPLSAEIEHSNLSCYGDDNASIEISATGGTSPYFYSYDNGLSFSANNISKDNKAAIYQVKVEDKNGCLVEDQVHITQPDSLQLILLDKTDVLCHGDSTGSVLVDALGGSGPYLYSFPAQDLTDENSLKKLSAGEYLVKVTDSNNCQNEMSVTLSQPDPLQITFETTPVICKDESNGVIEITSSGGSGDYQFILGDHVFHDTRIEDLSAGYYPLTLQDSYLCQLDTSVIIKQPEVALSANIDEQQHVSCYGIGDGGFSVHSEGGYGDYLYKFSEDFESLSSYEDLYAGNYSVQVKDSMGCEVEVSAIISQPDTLILSVAEYSDLDCYKDSSGFVGLYATGGTKSYLYSADTVNFLPDSIFQLLNAGNHTFTVKDSKGCSAVVNQTLTEPEPIEANVINVINAACGQDNGAAEIQASGGTGDLQYTWKNWNDEVVTTSKIGSNLYAGKYEMVIEDEHSCQLEISHSVTDDEAPELRVLSTDSVTCFGNSDGSAVVFAVGGAGGYEYSWSDPSKQTDSVAINLSSQEYTARVEDLRGCVSTVDVFVGSPEPLLVNIDTLSLPLCYDDRNGSIKVSGAGGTGKYSYLWDDFTDEFDPIIDSLASGNYKVIVKDENGCESDRIIELSDPEKLQIDSIGITNPSCTEYSDGRIDISVSGGTGDLKTIWKGLISNSFSFGGLEKGTYYPVIYDQNNCEVSDTVELTDPELLVLDTISVVDASCSYQNDGAVNLKSIGGTGSYTYQWKGFVSYSAPSKDDLLKGAYDISVYDINGCKDSITVNVDAPDSLFIELVEAADPLCFDGCDGSVEVNATGGTGDYSFTWDNGHNTGFNNGLCAGDYLVEVQDVNACKSEYTVVLSNPEPVDILLNHKKEVGCFSDCDGELKVKGTGGTGDYHYTWEHQNNDTDSAYDLCAGEYQIKMYDDHNCEATKIFEIKEPEQLKVKIEEIIKPLCHESEDGSILVKATGGNGKYEYVWPGLNFNISEASGLSKGDYLVEVKDSLQCFVDTTVTLNAPPLLEVDVLTTIRPECSDDCSGEIELFAYGGTAPYSYLWPEDINSDHGLATELCADIYAINVTDGHNCTTKKEVILNGPDVISLTVVEKIQPSCAASCDGLIEVIASGGTAPYSYEWVETGITENITEGLCKGQYTVKITDAMGCIYLQQIELSAPEPLQIELIETKAPICFQDADGTAEVKITGGTGPYNIEWDDEANQDTKVLRNVYAGVYSVAVMDANGCQEKLEVTIEEAPQIIIDLGGSRTLCLDQTAILDPGIDSLTYTWSSDNGFESNEQQIKVSNEGLYFITGISPQGCIAMDTFEIITSEESFDVNFLSASELISGDTLLITEVCYPAPDFIEWDFEGQPDVINADENQPQIIYSTPGKYEISMTAYRGECYDTKTKVTSWYDPSENPNLSGRIRLGEVGIKKVRLHPNPTDGKVFIDVTMHQESPLAVFIYDNFGKEIQRISKEEGIFYRFNFDLSHERNGTYHVKLVSNNDVRGLKIVKNK